MNHDLHIVVVDSVDGELGLVYLGHDSATANDLFGRVNAKAETARLFLYAQPSRIRHPAQEMLDSERRARLAETANNTQLQDLLAKLKAAQEGQDRHGDLVAQFTKDIRAIDPTILPPDAPTESLPPPPPPPPGAGEVPPELPPVTEGELQEFAEEAGSELVEEELAGEDAGAPRKKGKKGSKKAK